MTLNKVFREIDFSKQLYLGKKGHQIYNQNSAAQRPHLQNSIHNNGLFCACALPLSILHKKVFDDVFIQKAHSHCEQ